MTKINNTVILEKTIELYAVNGADSFSIRKLAKAIPIAPSVIYHYYRDEDTLLESMFTYASTELGIKRAQLRQPKKADEMLKQRIGFQIDNSMHIVAVLKYYLAFRNKFPKNNQGYVPDKSSLHIEEVLEYGVKTGEFSVENIQDDAKVITHAINGFLLEYYPQVPQGSERTMLINKIHKFILRALKGGDK
jgi:AcrR family transcriptional regulator